MSRQLLPTALTASALCTAALGLLLFPQETSQAVREGLTLCTDTLLPSLFPFFVLSSLAVKTGLAQLLGRALEPVMQPMFHLPGACSAALVLGFLGGYPTGAKTAAALYRDGLCTRQEAQRLLGFCNNCGPAFLIGAVGCGLFGDLRYGLLLMLVHGSAALLTGLLLNRKATAHSRNQAKNSVNENISPPAAFVESVTESFQALLNLFAFVLCFSAVIRLIQLSGIPALLSGLLFPFLSGENGETLLLGLLEMTCGVTQLGSGPLPERLILASVLLGWGGLSVHCQVLSLLQGTDLSPVPYLKGKALHGSLSALLMAAILVRAEVLFLPLALGAILLPSRTVKKSSGKSVEGVL